LSLQFGFGGEQIGQTLGLGQIDATVDEGAAGELARLGLAQARQKTQRMLNGRDHRSAAMAVQFGQIFTGRRLRSGNHSSSAWSSTWPSPSRSAP
jgi:hypothetical protein